MLKILINSGMGIMDKLVVAIKNLVRKLIDLILKKRKAIASYYHQDPERSAFLILFWKIQKEVNFLLNFNEAYQLYMDAKLTASIPGDMAEVGPYMGGSSKLLCEAKGSRSLYLFDTFAGLPETNTETDGNFHTGDFDGKAYTRDLYAFVKDYLKDYPDVYIFKGKFPDTAGPIKDKLFSFVHLDVDIYESTKKSLEFFYPRLSKGAMLISHDYEDGPGVQRAFREYMADKPEPIVQLFAGKQCLFVKQ